MLPGFTFSIPNLLCLRSIPFFFSFMFAFRLSPINLSSIVSRANWTRYWNYNYSLHPLRIPGNISIIHFLLQ